MKRPLVLSLVLLALSAGVACAGHIGIGAYAGMSYPVLQEDVASGTLYGLRAPVALTPLFTFEPYYASASLGDKDETVAGITYTRAGFDETAYGLNAMMTTGGPVQFYPLVGVGKTQLTREGSSDLNLTTWNLGLGLGFVPMPKLSIHIRGEMQMAMDGDASRKFTNLTVGASYALFNMP
jgi:hypothetical protein